eukprot:6197811-Pleurochrysis_carterae.AAC.1
MNTLKGGIVTESLRMLHPSAEALHVFVQLCAFSAHAPELLQRPRLKVTTSLVRIECAGAMACATSIC